jgi:hypothetical protein
MASTEPRAYLRFIVDEWPLIEAIYERTQRAAIRLHTLRELAAELSSLRTIERLIELGVIIPLPHSPAYEMGEMVQNLVAELKREHVLGLADEIRVYLEDLQKQTSGIVEALDSPDHEKLRRHAMALGSRIKAIQRQLRNNSQAVEDIATRAKTRRRYTPIHQRYAEVLEAWDSYVDPIREMVDPTGPFEALFEHLENELRHASRTILRHGGLIRERRNLDILLFRLQHLRGLLREHLAVAVDRLLPLVREIRRNSVIARGAAIALKQIRDGEWGAEALSAIFPMSRRVIPNAIAGPDVIEAFVADLQHFTPAVQDFAGPAEERIRAAPLFSADATLAELRGALPVPDLLAWLIGTCDPIADVDDLLDLYFNVLAPGSAFKAATGDPQQYESRTHRITARRVRVRGERSTT